MAITRRQKQVLDFIADFIETNGYSPSYEEIARGLELASLATVHKHIAALESKHYLKRGFNQSRSLDLSPKYYQEVRRRPMSGAALEVPLMGRITAGTPVEALAGSERLDFGDFLNRENIYALEVRGDSMIDDHICSGDIVLVENTSQARDGDIVVALLRGSETTLKRFYRESDTMAVLKPANAQMEPIRVPLADLQIQGRVLAVLRKY
ncbi:MAG TPA: transcriptional repressor LexA [Bryobacteraceae bacterium]|nr:transcriptional repressor LexA [Bryobacteraceae bacterium]HOL70592.1 transcriptional repressor LexA [Bryobacteraceae bacterium]HOQ44873.1 transcriptional repressor LexA [Bryobacteraceae bacterium]HPQ15534.1 transcriptional repressor LexA [Bryobacteraceae bacterium]HPU72116.1 transcriptional repressor LexA [Bryobacteraceae bacterium]